MTDEKVAQCLNVQGLEYSCSEPDLMLQYEQGEPAEQGQYKTTPWRWVVLCSLVSLFMAQGIINISLSPIAI